MRRKKDRSKQGQTNDKAKQHSTPKAVAASGGTRTHDTLHSRQSALPRQFSWLGPNFTSHSIPDEQANHQLSMKEKARVTWYIHIRDIIPTAHEQCLTPHYALLIIPLRSPTPHYTTSIPTTAPSSLYHFDPPLLITPLRSLQQPTPHYTTSIPTTAPSSLHHFDPYNSPLPNNYISPVH